MSRTALGTYIFAGGFTLGVKRAGFDVLAQLEDGPYGVATTRKNHPGLAVSTDPDNWPLADLAGRVDFIYGNPPCAPFSNSGVSTKKVGMMDNWWRTDPRAQCVTQMFKALEVVRPKVWAWESVQPALSRGKDLVAELTLVAKTLGYRASYVLIDAVHLGVPQRRRRVFVVFHNIEIDWLYPRPGMYLSEWEGPGSMLLREVPATVREAWEPITSGRAVDPELAGGNVPRHCLSQYNGNGILDRLPQGGSLKKIWERENPEESRTLNKQGKVKGRPGFLYKRLAWDGQSPTLTGSASKTFHPDLHRYITVLEKQLICGYPETYEFVGSPINKLAQIAQAVMPPVGEWLARNVMHALEKDVPADLEQPATIVDLEGTWRGGAPRTAETALMEHASAVSQAIAEDVDRRILATIDPVLPRFPSQASFLPLWEQYTGPTAIAKDLIVDGASDAEIIATTAKAIRDAKASGTTWPHLFTKTDLARLRARISRKENA